MEGLQVQRWDYSSKGMMARSEGDWVYFSDAEKFHESAQNLTAKTLTLTIEKDELAKQKKALGAALRRYGKHGATCYVGDGSGVRCNCGLLNVLRDNDEEF